MRIESLFIKQCDAQCAPPSIDEVDGNCANDIVDLTALQNDRGDRGEESCDDSNDQPRARRDIGAARSDSDKAA